MIYPGDLELQLGLTSAIWAGHTMRILIILSWCDFQELIENALSWWPRKHDNTAIARLWASYGKLDIARNHREVFMRVSIAIRICVGFTFLRIVIGLTNYKLNQNHDSVTHLFPRFLSATSICFELRFDWFTGLWMPFVIGQTDYFWFWFYDTSLKIALATLKDTPGLSFKFLRLKMIYCD